MLQRINLPDTVRLRPGTRGGWTGCQGCWYPGPNILSNLSIVMDKESFPAVTL